MRPGVRTGLLASAPVNENAPEIERAAADMWRSERVQRFGAWHVGYAAGYSRRANSATWVGPGVDGLEAAATWLREHNVRPTVRLTSEMPPHVDEALRSGGWALGGPTLVMVRDIGAAVDVSGIEIMDYPNHAWLNHVRLVAGIPENLEGGWRGILSRAPRPRGFAISDGVPVVAAGVGFISAGWIGLFQLGVMPKHRRQGLGRQTVDALTTWGREQGADRVLLQVAANNRMALPLYRGMGFSTEYEYWYRSIK